MNVTSEGKRNETSLALSVRFNERLKSWTKL